MNRLYSGLILAGALGLGLLLGPALRPPADDLVGQATWKDVYNTTEQMTQAVDAVALVTARGTEPGRVAESDSPEGTSVHYVLNHFTVDQVLKGALSAGGALTVEQTAEMHAGDQVVGVDGDGGPYEAGRQYLVFLNRQPDTGLWYVVSYQGRYDVQNDRLVGVVGHDDVVLDLHLAPLGDALARLSGYAAGTTDVVRPSDR
jgi:hypothetical protein